MYSGMYSDSSRVPEKHCCCLGQRNAVTGTTIVVFPKSVTNGSMLHSNKKTASSWAAKRVVNQILRAGTGSGAAGGHVIVFRSWGVASISACLGVSSVHAVTLDIGPNMLTTYHGRLLYRALVFRNFLSELDQYLDNSGELWCCGQNIELAIE